MTIGLVGKKLGMTQVFTEDGQSVPVTVIQATPNRVVCFKTEEKDGYSAVQVTAGACKPNRITKPMAGHFAKADVVAGRLVKEFRVDNAADLSAFTAGSEIKVDIFQAGQLVDVTGTTKGKGYAGTIKRHNFRGQDNSHGNSVSHRVPGSIGQNQTPGKVFKGKKMCGHMGNVIRTIQNQKVVQVDVERNIILIKGVVPGAPGCDVVIKPAIKCRTKEGNK